MAIKVIFRDRALMRQLDAAAKASPVAATRALTECVIDLSEKSMKRAPVESGDLRSNCHGEVQGQTVFENQKAYDAEPLPSARVSGSVGYSLPYALRQHEDMSMKHDLTNGHHIQKATRYNTNNGVVTTYSAASTVNLVAGGEAKFLEKPFDENRAKYIKHIKEAVIESLE